MTSSGALRFGQWPVAFRIDEFAVRHLPVHVLADRERGDHVLTALQDERRYRDLRKVGPVVGIERDAREFLRDVGVGPAEAVGELLAKLRPVGIAHDHGRHRGGPAHVIVGEEVQEFGDLLFLEAADIAFVVDIAGRRPHHDEALEHARRLERREQADHRAHGMADEDRVLQAKLVADLDNVVRVARERGVFFGIVGLQVGAARADMVEKDRSETCPRKRATRAATCSGRSQTRGRTSSPSGRCRRYEHCCERELTHIP